jgi:hypothetical protein
MPPTVIPFLLLGVLLGIAAVLFAAAIIAGSSAFTTWLFAQLWSENRRSRIYFLAALNSGVMFAGFLAFTCWTMWEWRPDNSFVLQGMLPWACTLAALICIFLHAGMGAIRQVFDQIPLPLNKR